MTNDPELTRDEAVALADDLGLQLYRAEDRVAFVREQLTGRTQPVEPATVLAWLDHEHCPRAESEQQQIARLAALAEARQHVIERMAREALHADGAVERVREWLDEWGPRLPDGACHTLDQALNRGPARRRSGPAAVTDHTYEGEPSPGRLCQTERFGQTCGAPWEQHRLRDDCQHRDPKRLGARSGDLALVCACGAEVFPGLRTTPDNPLTSTNTTDNPEEPR
jgi:hypothetical protein